MKFLFFLEPAHGHLNPTLAVAKELVERGDEVVYYVPSDLKDSVTSAGATARLIQDVPNLSQEAAIAQPRDYQSFLALMLKSLRASFRQVPRILELAKSENAQCAIYDPMCGWGQAVAKALKVQRATFQTTYALRNNSQLDRQIKRRVRQSPSLKVAGAYLGLLWQSQRLCMRYGIPRLLPPGMFTSTEALNLVPLPRRFQSDAEHFDERYLFFGPAVQPRGGPGDFPMEKLEGRPVLYISLGSTAVNQRPTFYQNCLKAFGGTKWQVVMNIGKTDPALLGEIPENVLLRSFVPQLEVLQKSQVIITHGGMNSTMEALWFAVPLVVVSQHSPEEAATAARVAELGLGLRLEPGNEEPEAIRAAVESVTNDPAYRARLAEMQTAMREAGGYRKAADALQRLAAVPA